MEPARRDAWTPVAGILAAITFVVGIILAADSPDSTDTDAQVLAWYADKDHRVEVICGAYFLAFCALFLVWFGAGIRRRLLAAGSGRLADIALGGAVLCAGLIAVGAAAVASVPAGQSLGGSPLSTADIARFLPSIGFGAILLFAMFGAIALIDAVSIVIYRTGILPRWLAWLGFLCAIVLLFGVVFFPIVALPIWLLAISIALLRRGPPAATAPV
jgi:hypothetical protein